MQGWSGKEEREGAVTYPPAVCSRGVSGTVKLMNGVWRTADGYHPYHLKLPRRPRPAAGAAQGELFVSSSPSSYKHLTPMKSVTISPPLNLRQTLFGAVRHAPSEQMWRW